MDNNNYPNQFPPFGQEPQNENYTNLAQTTPDKATKPLSNRVKLLFFLVICATVFTLFRFLEFDIFEDLPIFSYLSYAGWIAVGLDLLYVIFRKLFK